MKANGQPKRLPTEVGGWPALEVGTAPEDSDHNGMPSHWESRHFLNPNDPSDGSRVAANGYTNVENYLNELAERPRGSTSPDQGPDVAARFKLGTKGSLAYTPDYDRVKKGKGVVWKNPGSNFRSHTVTFWKGPWKGKRWTLAPGEKKLKTLTKKGTYRFRCTLTARRQGRQETVQRHLWKAGGKEGLISSAGSCPCELDIVSDHEMCI
jgi:plastocyanin